ncbi:MAG: glycine zipper 2TM domain-containing protein [Caulobacteraceae bacterium]
MNRIISGFGCAALAATLVTVTPAVSTAHTTSTAHRHHSSCEAYRHKKARQGTATGAVAGGVIGNIAAGRGSRTEGTLIGAALGGVIGHKVSADKHHCR